MNKKPTVIGYSEWMKELSKEEPLCRTKWTDEETLFILDASKMGYTARQIARKLGRTMASVHNRLNACR